MKLFRNRISLLYSILMIVPLLSACHGPEVKENKNNATAGSESLGHVASEKYIIDTKESVLTWEGSMVFGFEEEHIGYVYTSKCVSEIAGFVVNRKDFNRGLWDTSRGG